MLFDEVEVVLDEEVVALVDCDVDAEVDELLEDVVSVNAGVASRPGAVGK